MNLKEALRPLLAEDALRQLVRSYDVIGDVAIIRIPEDLRELENEIGRALLTLRPRLRLVACRDGDLEGEFRLAPLRRIAGTGGFATVHREYGITLHVDPSSVYFSPRSGSERQRLAALTGSQERVLVLFSGIAPLPLAMAGRAADCRIVAVEKNSAAHRLADKNRTVNRVRERVELVNDDAASFLTRCSDCFDRIAMPLPGSAAYLEQVIARLKKGGFLHYYHFCRKGEFAASAREVSEACRRSSRSLISANVISCGHVSVRTYRVCVDAQIN